jgi:hypothetical protein
MTISNSKLYKRFHRLARLDITAWLSCAYNTCSCGGLRLLALINLYIHSLYVLVSKILSSILNSLALIHPLYHPLSSLSTMRPTCHFI